MTAPVPRGFTLVEVAVALVVLTTATAAAAGLLLQAARMGRDADHRERLLWVATELADSLGWEPAGVPGDRLLPDGSRLIWGGGRVAAMPAGGGPPVLSIPVIPTSGRSMLGGLR